jgi:hypothetical protein
MKQFRDTLYFVCEDGTVWSFYSVGTPARSKQPATTGRIVGRGRSGGYHCVKPRNSSGWLVHQMVMECYGLPQPEGDYVIDHIDENKLNNDISNLQWIERGENVSKTFSQTRGTSRLTREQANEIREKFTPRVYTRKMLAEEFGVSEGTVKDILAGRYY